MEYIVSARKYRPLSFDTVVGQAALTTTLKNAVTSGKLAHAYLFCGPRGVGKTTCARIFAKAINCFTPTADGEACGGCESCNAFNEQRSFNIFELDAASNNSVENIKTLMEQTRIPPQVGRYKVFIIDEVHMLSTAAFNAFLKTLEEPPAHVIFILATTEKHKILPTIISRCQIYDFERMTVTNIISHLKHVAEKEGISYEDDALAVIAEKADGGMRDALSVFDQAASFCQGNITYAKVIEDLNVLDTENYFNLIDLCLDNKVFEVMTLVNSIINKGFDGNHLVNGLATHVRNVLMAKDPQTLPMLKVSERLTTRYASQAKKCPTPFLYKALKAMNACDINYRQSSNKRLLVELTLIEVAQLTQPDDGTASGRGPKRLKILFQKLFGSQADNAAPQVAAPEKRYAQLADDGRPTTVAEPAPMPRKVVKLGALGKSFANIMRKDEAAPTTDDDDTKAAPTGEDAAFTDEQLLVQWTAMCNRMPKRLAAIAARLKNITPKITDFPHVEVVADNEMQLNDIKSVINNVRATLRRDLHNSNIDLDLRLAKPEETKHLLTNRERFEELKTDHSAIAMLVEQLGLTIA